MQTMVDSDRQPLLFGDEDMHSDDGDANAVPSTRADGSVSRKGCPAAPQTTELAFGAVPAEQVADEGPAQTYFGRPPIRVRKDPHGVPDHVGIPAVGQDTVTVYAVRYEPDEDGAQSATPESLQAQVKMNQAYELHLPTAALQQMQGMGLRDVMRQEDHTKYVGPNVFATRVPHPPSFRMALDILGVTMDASLWDLRDYLSHAPFEMCVGALQNMIFLDPQRNAPSLWLVSDEKTLDESFLTTKSSNPTATQGWLAQYKKHISVDTNTLLQQANPGDLVVLFKDASDVNVRYPVSIFGNRTRPNPPTLTASINVQRGSSYSGNMPALVTLCDLVLKPKGAGDTTGGSTGTLPRTHGHQQNQLLHTSVLTSSQSAPLPAIGNEYNTSAAEELLVQAGEVVMYSCMLDHSGDNPIRLVATKTGGRILLEDVHPVNAKNAAVDIIVQATEAEIFGCTLQGSLRLLATRRGSVQQSTCYGPIVMYGTGPHVQINECTLQSYAGVAIVLNKNSAFPGLRDNHFVFPRDEQQALVMVEIPEQIAQTYTETLFEGSKKQGKPGIIENQKADSTGTKRSPESIGLTVIRGKDISLATVNNNNILWPEPPSSAVDANNQWSLVARDSAGISFNASAVLHNVTIGGGKSVQLAEQDTKSFPLFGNVAMLVLLTQAAIVYAPGVKHAVVYNILDPTLQQPESGGNYALRHLQGLFDSRRASNDIPKLIDAYLKKLMGAKSTAAESLFA